MSRPSGPIPDSYWVEPERLCAGEYPYARGSGVAEAKLVLILDAGIDTFIDLTEEGEYGLVPYSRQLEGLEYVRLPIRDLGVPTRKQMREILDRIDDALSRGRTVYVHCFGGIGRTGTVVACWLVSRGGTPGDVLTSISEWRRETPDGHKASPETLEQVRFVHDWGA